MKVIVEFYQDCGRMGDLSGMFVCDKAELEKLYDKTVYFGEVLGKHSDVEIDVTTENLTVKTDDQDFIAKFIEIMGDGTISGYNPFDYIDEDELNEDEEEEEED